MAFDVEDSAVPSLAEAVKAAKGNRGLEADAVTDALEAERRGVIAWQSDDHALLDSVVMHVDR